MCYILPRCGERGEVDIRCGLAEHMGQKGERAYPRNCVNWWDG